MITLLDGRRVSLRPLQYLERAPVRELYAHLSPRSRYLRFLSPMPALPDTLVDQLTAVDGRSKVALVAESVGAPRNTVALGSFDAIDGTSVEVALAVRDDWQRQRLGTTIALRLLGLAEARGYGRFIATFDVHNTAVRRLINRVGVVVSSAFYGGVSEVTFIRRRTATSAPLE
jgi:GNAT superfamily N-acetyltransferase